jgi:hypothetical protein
MIKIDIFPMEHWLDFAYYKLEPIEGSFEKVYKLKI